MDKIRLTNSPKETELRIGQVATAPVEDVQKGIPVINIQIGSGVSILGLVDTDSLQLNVPVKIVNIGFFRLVSETPEQVDDHDSVLINQAQGLSAKLMGIVNLPLDPRLGEIVIASV